MKATHYWTLILISTEIYVDLTNLCGLHFLCGEIVV